MDASQHVRKQTLDAWLESQEVYRDNDEAFASSGRFKQIGKERDAAGQDDGD